MPLLADFSLLRVCGIRNVAKIDHMFAAIDISYNALPGYRRLISSRVFRPRIHFRNDLIPAATETIAIVLAPGRLKNWFQITMASDLTDLDPECEGNQF